MTIVPLTDDGDEGRWRWWKSNRPVPLPFLPRPSFPRTKYDGIIKCLGLHIQNQWLCTFNVRIGVGGIYLLPSYPDNRVCALEGGWIEELQRWGKFRGRHFKQPHYHYRLILFLDVSFSFTVYLADATNLSRPIFYSLWMLRISKIRIVFVFLYYIHTRAHAFILIGTKNSLKFLIN